VIETPPDVLARRLQSHQPARPSAPKPLSDDDRAEAEKLHRLLAELDPNYTDAADDPASAVQVYDLRYRLQSIERRLRGEPEPPEPRNRPAQGNGNGTVIGYINGRQTILGYLWSCPGGCYTVFMKAIDDYEQSIADWDDGGFGLEAMYQAEGRLNAYRAEAKPNIYIRPHRCLKAAEGMPWWFDAAIRRVERDRMREEQE
jgi:hypothetical protein